MNLLRLFQSPLNGFGLLSQISLGDAVEVISLSLLLSLVLYSNVLSCLLVVSWSDSGLGTALMLMLGVLLVVRVMCLGMKAVGRFWLCVGVLSCISGC